MITCSAMQGRVLAVFGLGKAGEATIASLLAGGAQVFAWDDHAPGCERVRQRFGGAVRLAPPEQWPWETLSYLVLSPGVPLTHPAPHPVVERARSHGCEVIGDIELLYRACPKARFVAITGTNGKSTTTTLIGHILEVAGVRAQVGGNLGTAALALEPLGEDGVYVIETSSYQLDLLSSVRFQVAAFLNVTPDHLDRHGSMEGYLAAKMHIFDRQQPGDSAVVAVDDVYTRRVADELSARDGLRLVRVSAQEAQGDGVYVQNGVLHDGAHAFDLRGIATLTGRHNWQNAAVAYGVARALGVAPEVIYRALQSFGGLRHRLQLAATIRGVRFINDSKATNADATSHALVPYDAIYWIAGGKAKEGGIDSLAAYFPKITHAFLIGAAQEAFAAVLKAHRVPHTLCTALDKAFDAAAQKAFADGKPDAVVLLSPACASFDQWKSFEERGDAFCALAQALEQREGEGQRHAL